MITIWGRTTSSNVQTVMWAIADQMYSTAYFSTAEWNDTHFRNAEFDALVLQARGELDQTKRADLYAQLARIL